jgi:hypothetical protein
MKLFYVFFYFSPDNLSHFRISEENCPPLCFVSECLRSLETDKFGAPSGVKGVYFAIGNAYFQTFRKSFLIDDFTNELYEEKKVFPIFFQ